MAPKRDLEEWRKQSGECIKCTHYNYSDATFSFECYECKRFYADKFESREINNDQIR